MDIRSLDRRLAPLARGCSGTAILVNLNGRIDYFGSTVNKASRIQSTATPDELVLSSEVRADSAVADALFRDCGPKLHQEHIKLKGIATDKAIFRLAAFNALPIVEETNCSSSTSLL